MEFIIQHKHTGLFVSDVSRVNFQIEKTADKNQARIFNENWLGFWETFDTYKQIPIVQKANNCSCQKYPGDEYYCQIHGGSNQGAKSKWTAEERLGLIQRLASKSIDGPRGESHRQLMERILFLCDMPSEFLEANEKNYEDVIGMPDDITVIL